MSAISFSLLLCVCRLAHATATDLSTGQFDLEELVDAVAEEDGFCDDCDELHSGISLLQASASYFRRIDHSDDVERSSALPQTEGAISSAHRKSSAWTVGGTDKDIVTTSSTRTPATAEAQEDLSRTQPTPYNAAMAHAQAYDMEAAAADALARADAADSSAASMGAVAARQERSEAEARSKAAALHAEAARKEMAAAEFRQNADRLTAATARKQAADERKVAREIRGWRPPPPPAPEPSSTTRQPTPETTGRKPEEDTTTTTEKGETMKDQVEGATTTEEKAKPEAEGKANEDPVEEAKRDAEQQAKISRDIEAEARAKREAEEKAKKDAEDASRTTSKTSVTKPSNETVLGQVAKESGISLIQTGADIKKASASHGHTVRTVGADGMIVASEDDHASGADGIENHGLVVAADGSLDWAS